MDIAPDSAQEATPKWRPLSSRQRRVLGVLIEKAKTTPDAYPMTLNAVTTGCNQKSNRSPQMELKPDDVETIMDELREIGAVVEVQTSGRMPKYRHQMYDWLGVDKVELAVMAELLLRGEQTVGELRARAARMEPIATLEDLRPVLRSLMDKDLVIALSPEGRGQLVSHGLYKERELAELHARAGSLAASSTDTDEPRSAAATASRATDQSELRAEVQQLRDEVAELRAEIEHLKQLLS
jgi:uncharacterized protein